MKIRLPERLAPVLIAALLCGCGQTGALVLPNEAVPRNSADGSPTADPSDQEEDESEQ